MNPNICIPIKKELFFCVAVAMAFPVPTLLCLWFGVVILSLLWIYLLVDVHPLTFHMIVTTTSEWIVMWPPLTFHMIVTPTSEWIVMWSSIYLYVSYK